MCRVVAYLGEKISLSSVLFGTDSSLASQAYSPRMMATFLNLAGFGMAAWDPSSFRGEDPFTYRVTMLPVFDRNLRRLSDKIEPTSLIAHVRGVTHSDNEVVTETNLHPFHFRGARVLMAHNGHMREFARMRYDLVRYVSPELLGRIEGTTDSEWVYAVMLSQLEDPHGLPTIDELAEAVLATLRILREVRARHGIDTSSPLNLFIGTGDQIIATRFSFDYGWYPAADSLLETDLPYVSLWYTIGGRYAELDGEFKMSASDEPGSILISSEPLTRDTSTWLEAPEYSLLAATRTTAGISFRISDIDV